MSSPRVSMRSTPAPSAFRCAAETRSGAVRPGPPSHVRRAARTASRKRGREGPAAGVGGWGRRRTFARYRCLHGRARRRGQPARFRPRARRRWRRRAATTCCGSRASSRFADRAGAAGRRPGGAARDVRAGMARRLARFRSSQPAGLCRPRHSRAQEILARFAFAVAARSSDRWRRTRHSTRRGGSNARHRHIRRHSPSCPRGRSRPISASRARRSPRSALPGSLAALGAGRTVDAAGQIVIPGGIDPHVHCRWPMPIPGQTQHNLTDGPDAGQPGGALRRHHDDPRFRPRRRRQHGAAGDRAAAAGMGRRLPLRLRASTRWCRASSTRSILDQLTEAVAAGHADGQDVHHRHHPVAQGPHGPIRRHLGGAEGLGARPAASPRSTPRTTTSSCTCTRS